MRGLGAKETAERLSISRANVSVRLNRALWLLRKRCEGRLRANAGKHRDRFTVPARGQGSQDALPSMCQGGALMLFWQPYKGEYGSIGFVVLALAYIVLVAIFDGC